MNLWHRQLGLRVNRDGVIGRRDFVRGVSAAGLAAGLAAGALNWSELVSAKADELRSRGMACILLFMRGGPSQFETFSPKPGHENGGETKAIPTAVSGIEIAENFPAVAKQMNDIALIRSMYTEHNNHTEATVMINTGKTSMGRPSMGSWISYAIGSENQNLPSFVVLRDPKKYDTAGSLSWSAGWLPAKHQGTEFNSQGPPVPNLYPRNARPAESHQANLDFLAKMNESHRQRFPQESELEARIKNYELAGRMQVAAGDALNIASEPESIRKMYGLDNPASAAYGTRCLMARRLIESGVRFVQVYPDQEGQSWDSHSKLPTDLPRMCRMTDLATAGLIRDLAQRGLLEDTIVLWAGEFGRLPTSQNADGRDHNRHAFSLLVTGGGFKGGRIYGQTDDFGYKSVTDRVSVPDLHATILQQLGIDHRALTFRHHGRDETLTDAPATGARVVNEILS